MPFGIERSYRSSTTPALVFRKSSNFAVAILISVSCLVCNSMAKATEDVSMEQDGEAAQMLTIKHATQPPGWPVFVSS